MLRLLSITAVALLLCARPCTAEFTSYAIVRADGSLLIRNKVVRLLGVYIPNDRAVAAMNRDIHGFITCQEMGAYDDGSISAVCWKHGNDVGAGLISNGIALAGPDAPFEYVVSERIAQSNGRGIWGMGFRSVFRPVIILPNGTVRFR